MFEQKYPHLFSPITIRKKTVRNRITASPHANPSLFCPSGNGWSQFSDEAVSYYGHLAKGGAGIVSTGHLGVDPRFYIGKNREGFDLFEERAHIQLLPQLHRISDVIHAYGSLAGFELNHGGEKSTPVDGSRVVPGPCDKTLEDGTQVKAMDAAEMARISDYFVQAALIGKRAGFDIIYVHAAHNWLLGQFFSPLGNHRTDAYGGSVENRARFPHEVLTRIRQAVGEDMLIEIRFSASELLEGGMTVDEAAETIRILSDVVDMVQCSVGKIHNRLTTGFLYTMPYSNEGVNSYWAGEIKKRVQIPVETIGGINTPEFAEQLIASGTVDFVSMARQLVADPDWGEKARLGRSEDIRPCIRCLRCLNFSALSSGHSVCTVNPEYSVHTPIPTSLDRTGKRVVVIGGGPAGMEAVKDLAAKGHRVTLIEKRDRLGGRLEFADHMAFKARIRAYREYLITQVRKSGAELRLGVEATPELVASMQPDAVVLAGGAKDLVPPIPGVDKKLVCCISEIFGRERELGEKIVVIGGGAVGCELTVHLQTLGKRVDVVEMRSQLIADGAELPEESFFTKFYMTHELDMARKDLIGIRETDRVRTYVNTRCEEIADDGVWVCGEDGERRFLPADTVILATGFVPDRRWTESFEGTAPTVIAVGDCDRVRTLLGASSGGYYAALRI